MECDRCVDRERIQKFIKRDEYNIFKYVLERLKREGINNEVPKEDMDRFRTLFGKYGVKVDEFSIYKYDYDFLRMFGILKSTPKISLDFTNYPSTYIKNICELATKYSDTIDLKRYFEIRNFEGHIVLVSFKISRLFLPTKIGRFGAMIDNMIIADDVNRKLYSIMYFIIGLLMIGGYKFDSSIINIAREHYD